VQRLLLSPPLIAAFVPDHHPVPTRSPPCMPHSAWRLHAWNTYHHHPFLHPCGHQLLNHHHACLTLLGGCVGSVVGSLEGAIVGAMLGRWLGCPDGARDGHTVGPTLWTTVVGEWTRTIRIRGKSSVIPKNIKSRSLVRCWGAGSAALTAPAMATPWGPHCGRRR
jgi:hypothetical protein